MEHAKKLLVPRWLMLHVARLRCRRKFNFSSWESKHGIVPAGQQTWL